ncbi:MAG: hypothetical protein ACRD10_09080, partial [Terriglobia bacterium]
IYAHVARLRVRDLRVEIYTMSRKVLNALFDLKRTVEKNTPRVEKKFAKAGISPDPALVFSTAQYYDTLKKLAKK